MEEKQKFFPAQESDEKVLYIIRRHWFTYFILWLLVLLFLVPVTLYLIYWIMHFQDYSVEGNLASIFVLSATSLILVGLLIYGFIDYYLDVYILTDRRIVDIKQDGFFKRKISELNLRQVQDVNAQVSGIFPTLFHYGNVFIQTAGEKENFIFESIPHPYTVSKKILELHQYSLRRGKGSVPGGSIDSETEIMPPQKQSDILEGIDKVKSEDQGI